MNGHDLFGSFFGPSSIVPGDERHEQECDHRSNHGHGPEGKELLLGDFVIHGELDQGWQVDQRLSSADPDEHA